MNETRLSRKLQEIQVNIDAAESVVIDIIAGVTPWLAPLIPAYMAYQNMKSDLQFHWLLALSGALVIEFLGLATVSTAVQFASYNDVALKRNIKQQGKAPFWWAVAMGVFYLTIILSVNAILDYGNEQPAHIFTRALLSLISVPAAVTIAIRSQHKRRLQEVAQPKQKQPSTQPQTKPAQRVASLENHQTGQMSATRKAVYETARGNPNATHDEIADLLADEHGIQISRQMVGKHLRALNGAVKETS